MPDAPKKVPCPEGNGLGPSGDKTPQRKSPGGTLDFTSCPNWGKGGRYVVDADGRRTPVLAPEPNAAVEPPSACTGDPQSGCTGEHPKGTSFGAPMQPVEGGVLESTPAAPDRAIPDPATAHAHRTPRKPR